MDNNKEIKKTEEIKLDTKIQNEPQKEEEINFEEFDPDMKKKGSDSPKKSSIFIANKSSITSLPNGDMIDYDFLATLDDKTLVAKVKDLVKIDTKTMDPKEIGKLRNLRNKIKSKVRNSKKPPKQTKKEKVDEKIVEEEILDERSNMITDIMNLQDKSDKKIYSLETLKDKSKPELNKILASFMENINGEISDFETERAIRILFGVHLGYEVVGNIAAKSAGLGPVLMGSTKNMFGSDEKRQELKELLPKLVMKYPKLKTVLSPEFGLLTLWIQNSVTTIQHNTEKFAQIKITQGPSPIVNTQNITNNNIPIINDSDIKDGIDMNKLNEIFSPPMEKKT